MTPKEPRVWLERLDSRLAAQLQFLIEADRLKCVLRGCRIADGSRRENSAEHSWHLALFAIVLCEWATDTVDLSRVIQMLVLHDIIEIECGDSPVHDKDLSASKAAREAVAAEKLFRILPADQRVRFHDLWEEFEEAQSPDARFAKALNRLQPVLLNHLVGGGTWLDYDVDEEQERSVTRNIAAGSAALWEAAELVFAEAVQNGWLKPRL
ncbi:MAG: HD domain-containing protein [Luteitalea sp.]|nr:HD domain-containing protein [Luteitalea sp.]